MALLTVKSNTEIEEDIRREAMLTKKALDELEAEETGYAYSSIVGFLRSKWDEAKRAKMGIEHKMLQNMRQAMDTYSPQQLSAIRSVGGSEAFLSVTRTKCRSAVTWVREIIGTYKMWSVKPTPMPSQDGAVQIANENDIVTMVEKKIDDILTEGGWYTALYEAIFDIIVTKNGFVKGPIKRIRYEKKEVVNNDGSVMIDIVPKIVFEFERRSPFDIYPAPDSTGINDGYLFDHISLRRNDLYALIGIQGFNEDAIRRVLRKFQTSGYRDWTGIEAMRAQLEGRSPESVYTTEKIDCLEYWGPVQGRILREWGMSPDEVPDEDADYDVCAWLIDNEVIGIFMNEDPNGRKPFYTASFEVIPDAFWGVSLPETIASIQEIINAVTRALVNNIAMASGPQVVLNMERLARGDKINIALQPWKIWLSTNKMMQPGPPIEFWQPNMHAHEMLTVLDSFVKYADEYSGVPSYAHGDFKIGGAGSTASGLSMLLSQAARGIKGVVRNIEQYIIVPSISYIFELIKKEYNNVDTQIVPMGPTAMLEKEQKIIRMLEFLNIVNNPVDIKITGIDGRAYLLSEAAMAYEIDPDKFLAAYKQGMTEQTPIPQEETNAGQETFSEIGMYPEQKSSPTELSPGGMKPVGLDYRMFEEFGGGQRVQIPKEQTETVLGEEEEGV